VVLLKVGAVISPREAAEWMRIIAAKIIGAGAGMSMTVWGEKR